MKGTCNWLKHFCSHRHSLRNHVDITERGQSTTQPFEHHIPTEDQGRPRTRLLSLVTALLVASLLIGSLVLLLSQRKQQGVARAGGTFVITPDGGSPLTPTSSGLIGGLLVLIPPDPAYYLDGYLYHDTSVYQATTGTPATRYEPHLGNLPAHNPQLVNGIVYLTGQVQVQHGSSRPSLFALRPTDGTVLWQWSNCGQNSYIGDPVFSGSSLYLVCEAASGANPSWRLVSLQARTGALLWSDELAAEPGYPLLVDQQGVYLPLINPQHDRLLAWSPATGQLLWQRSFGDQGYQISSISLGPGIVYVSEAGDTGPAFSALATSSGATLWEYQFRGDFNDVKVVVAPQTVYLFPEEQSGPPTLYAVNSRTGVLRWHRQLPGEPEWPQMDQGNLYLLYNVYGNPQAFNPLPNPTPVARGLLALSGSNGQSLWQTEIPWNSRQLSFSENEVPSLTFGAGQIYLVDWRVAHPFEAQQQTSIMGAFAERTGVLLWATPVD